MTQLHALPDGLFTDGLGGTHLADIVLLLSSLGPVGSRGPSDLGQASVLLVFAGLDCLQTLFCVSILPVTNIALQR